MSIAEYDKLDFAELAKKIKLWGNELGFQQVGITDTHLPEAEEHLNAWLSKGHHGEMTYMASHGTKRSRPSELIPGTIRAISLRMDYLPPNTAMVATLKDRFRAYISRYALGRDYHKLIRKRCEKLAQKIQNHVGSFNYRVFCDSAPVLEKPLAEKAGLGWQGKHTLLINAKAGSWFFLGSIYTDLPLPIDEKASQHCGTCHACIDVCPTQAIIGPYQLDARRCISYHTIELRGSIPENLRPLIGNRIYGCDDCQLVCPWNKYAKTTAEIAFHSRHQLDQAKLIELFAWDENDFNRYTEGSAIRRVGYEGWLRNIAVALGNAPFDLTIQAALERRMQYPSELVKEHVVWALNQQRGKIEPLTLNINER
jgi:epoxyqueuosine reductase